MSKNREKEVEEREHNGALVLQMLDVFADDETERVKILLKAVDLLILTTEEKKQLIEGIAMLLKKHVGRETLPKRHRRR